jgi:hypothetical protein
MPVGGRAFPAIPITPETPLLSLRSNRLIPAYVYGFLMLFNPLSGV